MLLDTKDRTTLQTINVKYETPLAIISISEIQRHSRHYRLRRVALYLFTCFQAYPHEVTMQKEN